MIEVLTDEQLDTFRRKIDAAKNIIVCGHVNPDGDAIGTSLALCHWLTQKGKSVQVAMPNFFPDFLHWMPGADRILNYTKKDLREKARG